jgi:hypothetical protein
MNGQIHPRDNLIRTTQAPAMARPSIYRGENTPGIEARRDGWSWGRYKRHPYRQFLPPLMNLKPVLLIEIVCQ